MKEKKKDLIVRLIAEGKSNQQIVKSGFDVGIRLDQGQISRVRKEFSQNAIQYAEMGKEFKDHLKGVIESTMVASFETQRIVMEDLRDRVEKGGSKALLDYELAMLTKYNLEIKKLGMSK